MSKRNPLTDEQLDDIWKEMLKPDSKKPPRLDRSAWEPCENCGCKCRVCFRNGTDRCKKCKNYDLYIPISHFCQCCGRPLTDAAWKMLEKRLEGTK